LVAITPACGFVGPMGALIIGLVSGVACVWGVNGLKRLMGADDSLDVFGVHGVGGIVGALLTGVFAAPSLGGTGVFDYVKNAANPDFSIAGQVWIQLQGVLITIVLSAVVAFIAFKIVDMLVGLRVAEDDEREGLDAARLPSTCARRRARAAAALLVRERHHLLCAAPAPAQGGRAA
jgi:Amt family ammonium transporter